MGKAVRNTDDGLPILEADQDTSGLPILKKKEGGTGSPSPSGSSPIPKEEKPTGTSESDPKQVTANFKNQSLRPKDLNQPMGISISPSIDQMATSINNKSKNLERWRNVSDEQYVTSLVNQQKRNQDAINQLSTQQELAHAKHTPGWEDNQRKLESLQQTDKYLKGEIGKQYQERKKVLVPELLSDVQSMLGGGTWTDIYDKSNAKEKTAFGVQINHPLEWNANHTLTEKSVRWIADQVDGIMNKKKDPSVNAAMSGDLEDKPRTYADLTKALVDELNLVPIQKAQQDFTKEYAKKNPDIEKALKANEEVHAYFSSHNFEDLKAKIKIQADQEQIKTQERYYGKNGLLTSNPAYVQIAQKYAQLVGEGKMTKEVAFAQIESEAKQHPELKKIQDNFDRENKKIIEATQKQYQDWIIGGLQKDHPQYTVYSDGRPGIASLSEDQYNDLMKGYIEGMQKVAKDMGAEANEAWKKDANEKASRVGPFWGSLGMSLNELGSGLTKMIFHKTGWGGERMRMYEANEIANPQISQSDVAASWNWRGWESILDPKFYLSGAGKMVPVIAGGVAITATTEGSGLPEYIGWLANASLFTAQSSLSTYDQLLNSKDENGNLISEGEASARAANQAKEDFLPNVLMMAVSSGTLFRSKNIIKPSIGRTIATGLGQTVAAQPFFTWQGYNDYATMKEAQGGKADFWDYMQSKDFKDNLVNGMILGGALSMVHSPGQFMKSMDGWSKLVHTSEGEFKNLLSQNYTLGQEMKGNGDYLRDALKMHIFNIDPEGLNEEGKRQLADLKNSLVYSTNLNKNIKLGNLDRGNINNLYQAHNLALADQYEFLSAQAAEKGNKTLADLYSDKSKTYREEAKAAANDQAKFHYAMSPEDTPIFMSDQSFKGLEKEGRLRDWITDGTIKSIHKSDDPEFARRYDEFVKAKNESEIHINPEDFQRFLFNQESSNAEDNHVQTILGKMNDAEYINEKELNRAADHLYNLLDETDKRTDLTEEQKKSIANLVEPLIQKIEGYDFRTTTKTSTTTEKIPTFVPREAPKREIKPALEQSAGSTVTVTLPDGGQRQGVLNLRDGTYTVDVPGGDQIVLGEKAISDRDLKLPSPEEMENPIKFDKDGNVESVTFKTGKGDLVAITDPDKALDLAIQLRADAIGEVPDQQFDTIYNEMIKETSEEVPVKDISSSKKEGGPNASEVRENQGKLPQEREKIGAGVQESGSGNVQQPTETGTKAGDQKDEVRDGGGRKEPPPSPRVSEDSPKEEFTAVRKEKLHEIKLAKDLFGKKKSIPWSQTYDSALANVMSKYPNKPLFEAMRARVEEFVAKIDNKETFAPTSEDHALFNVFRNEVEQRMADIQGWNSDSNLDRMDAVTQATILKNDLYNLAKVVEIGGSESGRALQILQSEVNIDPEDGLRLRRMDVLTWKNGAKLTQEDMDWTAKMWDKEQELAHRAKGVTDKKMNEGFQKELNRIRSEYERRLKQVRAEVKPAEGGKREKALSERGKAFADRIRGAKFKKDQAYSVPFPGFTQSVNFVLETIAQAVEKGATLAEAIDGFLKDHRGKDKDQFTRDLFTVLDKQDLMSSSFGKIQTLADTEGATDITQSMVSKNWIRDFVDSHVGLHETGKVLDVAYDTLKEILPDLQKDKMVEAYLKQGEYAQPTKSKLEDSFKEQKRNFDKLVRLEKDINDLKSKNDLFKQHSSKPSPYEKDVLAKEKELQNVLESMGIKNVPEDKYRKASYEGRAQAHNNRLEDIQNAILDKVSGSELPSKVQKSLEKLFDLVGEAKIQLDPTSALSQDRSMEGGLMQLKSIRSEFNRNIVDSITQVGDINRMINRAIDGFASDKEQSEQDIKLSRAKDQAKRDMEKYFGKISRGEYEDNPPVVLSKTDPELIKLQRDRDVFRQMYLDKQREYQKGNKTVARRVADFARSLMVDYLIGGPLTIAKVFGSAVVRPNFEALTKLTFGKLFESLSFETTKAIVERAKAGGESLSLRSIKAGYKAYLGAYSEDQMKSIVKKANDAYEEADRNWRSAQEDASGKQLTELKNKRDDALVSSISASMFQYISGNSFKEAWEVLLHRSTQLERQFGDFGREAWNKNPGILNKLDNIQYIANYAGRSHAALKNFSARQSFAAGFMARVEYAVEHGQDISSPEHILELAHDSYLDWERGKYQEANWVSDTWNKLTNKIEQVSPEMAYLFRSDIAITRVPVNILREAVYEYAAGFVKAGIEAAREYYKAKGIILQDGYTPESQAQFEKELKEQLQNIDPKQAATIVRAFRKGGVGLGMYALAILGGISFGGWAHRGQTNEDKKKTQRELETGQPEIKTSEVHIGNWKVPEAVGKIIEHMPAFYPAGFAGGLVQVYKNNVVDGKTTKEAAFNSLTAQVEHAVNSIPQSELITYLAGKGLEHIKPSAQWDDIDQNGNPIKRKVFHLSDYLIHLPGFSKKGALSEGYYKQAVQTQKSYRDQITEVETNLSLSKQQKEEQRQQLLKEMDDAIDEIYQQNKENPQ